MRLPPTNHSQPIAGTTSTIGSYLAASHTSTAIKPIMMVAARMSWRKLRRYRTSCVVSSKDKLPMLERDQDVQGLTPRNTPPRNDTELVEIRIARASSFRKQSAKWASTAISSAPSSNPRVPLYMNQNINLPMVPQVESPRFGVRMDATNFASSILYRPNYGFAAYT